MTTVSPIKKEIIKVKTWLHACYLTDLIDNSGVCALVNDTQIAIFAMTDSQNNFHIYACDNYDPCGHANVLSRGIICSMAGETCICSPLYKQHFSLLDGRCLEDADTSINIYQLRVQENEVFLLRPVSKNN